MMDDPLSRALREDEQEQQKQQQHNYDQPASNSLSVSDYDLNEKTSSLSISHTHNEWMLPSTNENSEEAEIHREKVQISISDPKKHKSNLDSYVTYLVTTRTFNDGVQINESNVRRRYNDFVWLKHLLDTKYPFHILSPLPLKHSLSKKFHVVADDGDFIRRRMIGLQNFLQRLMDNPVISIDPSVQLFLSANDETLHSAQQEPVITTSSPSISATTNTNIFRAPIGRGKPIPSEFSRHETQIQTLQENLKKLERLTRKIESEEVGVHTENENFLVALEQWLDVERKYAEDERYVEILVNAQRAIVHHQADLLKSVNVKFLEPINDYVLFSSIVQDVLKRRAQLSEHVSNTPNEDMFDQLTIANETIKADIQRWTEAKDKEFIQLFRSMANKKIDFYSQSIDAWEQAAARFSSASTNNSQ